ncbi:MAG: TonB-dependent receptor [Piscirickettsiaceae bacterium]|nr:TonB-dependent receptor [Piscirickettsiaceae bacterium]
MLLKKTKTSVASKREGQSLSLQANNERLNSISMATTLALAVSTAMMGNVHAEEISTLDALVIEESGIAVDAEANPYAEPNAPYKAKRLSDSRRTRDIADTPATITVLTKDYIADSGKTELKDILSAQPGITLGTGEGGNSFGDRYVIRGYEARSDIYVDGLRDPGLITRETFAIEQIEISKGPSSTFAGRGSTGGAVNSVTKKATFVDDFTTLSGGLGTDSYQRYTLDANKVVNDRFAVRLNVLYTDADIPNRAPAAEQRQGALLSGVFQATDKFAVSADYYHFRGDDRTDTGTGMDSDGRPDNDRDHVGQDGLDFQETGADIFTVKLDWNITENFRIENKTRVGNTVNEYIITGYERGNLRQFTGWQENDYLGNQTTVMFDTKIWGQQHNFIGGIELAKEETDRGNYDVNTTNTFTIDPNNADNGLWAGSTSKNDKSSALELVTQSLFFMDTITLNEDWEVFAGIRYDHFEYELWTAASAGRGPTPTPVPATTYKYSDSFWNGHLGVVFSPWENGNVYASWSTSSNINGGEADAGTSCGYGGLCNDSDGNYNAEPEQAENFEIGTKWNLFDNNLLLTAAAFLTKKDDVIESGVDSYDTGGSFNTGANRVHGVEFGLSGNITPKLSGQMGLAIMDSKTTDSYFDGTVATSGRGGTISYPDNIGLPKANFAKKSLSVQLRYQYTPKFAFGGNLTYASGILGGQPDAGSEGRVELPGYTVYDMFASYKLSSQLDLRVNVQNITDKEYYTAVYRGGSIVYIGDARAANATLTYKF